MKEQATLLIVDDSEDEIRLTERILRRIDPAVRVVSAMSGEEALALLRGSRTQPALTLLDLKMTGIDGIETLRMIRADEQLKKLAVAVITNSTLESDRDKAMSAGADAVLRKAMDLDLFAEDLRRELEKRILR